MPRLSLTTLSALPGNVARPDYDVGAVAIGIVHLGLGAFHRAHQAVYTDAILRRDPQLGDLRREPQDAAGDGALAPQDGLYAVLEKSAAGTSRARDRRGARNAVPRRRARSRASRASPIRRPCRVADGHREGLLPRSGDGTARPAASRHRARSRASRGPARAVGVLVAGLAARRGAGGRRDQRRVLRQPAAQRADGRGIVAAFAQARAIPRSPTGSARTSRFPCTMVDRIVPATTDADIAEAARLLGVADAAPVVAEPFNSWVIEDALRCRASRVGGRRRADRRRRRAVRDDEAAPAERQPLDARVPRLPRRPRLHLAGVGRSAARGADRAPDDGRGRADARSAAGRRSPRVLRRALRRASAIPRCRTARSRSRWTARRSCRSGCSARCATGSRGGGSIAHLALAIAGWIRYAGGRDEHGQADRGVGSAWRRSSRRSRRRAAATPRRSPTASSISPRCSAPTCRAMRCFAARGEHATSGACSATASAARSPCISHSVPPRRAMSTPAARSFIPTGSSRPIPRRASLARALYATVEELPIVSPHGHTDPQWYADDAPFPDASALFITPDHYVFRMLYSQGIRLEDLGIPRRDGGPVEQDARKIWRTFAAHYHLFRGTPTRIWLDHAFATVFGCTERLTAESADRTFDRINECLARPEFRPRALFERFNIEVIATTESPLDPLAHHRKMRASGWKRPRASPRTGPIRSSIPSSRASATTCCSSARSPARTPRRGPATSPRTASRRAYFKTMGATSTDHGHPTARTCDLAEADCQRLLDRALAGTASAGRGRAVPRPDADRDGADEPRRRAGDADPSGLVAQPQSARLPRLRPRQGRRHPDAAPTTCAR